MHSYNLDKSAPVYSMASPGVELTGMIMEQNMMILKQQQQQLTMMRERREFVRSYVFYSLVFSCISIILFGLAFMWITSNAQPEGTSSMFGLSLKLAPNLDLKQTSGRNSNKDNNNRTTELVLEADTLQPNLAKLPYCLLPRHSTGQLDLIRNIKAMRETIHMHTNLSNEHLEHINPIDLEGPFSVRGELSCRYSGISVLKGNPVAVEMCNTKPIWQLATLFEFAGFKQVEVVPGLSYGQLVGLMDRRIPARPGFFMEVGLTMSRQGRSRGRWFPYNGGQMVNVDFWRDQNLDLKFLVKDYQERPFHDELSEGSARFSTTLPDEASQFDVLLFPEQHLVDAGHYEQPADFNISEARAKTKLSPEYARRLQAIDFRTINDDYDQEQVDEVDELDELEADVDADVGNKGSSRGTRGTSGKPRGGRKRRKQNPLGCNLCSMAAFKSKTVSELLKELQAYEEPPPVDPIVDFYHRQGVENLQLSVGMNRQEYLEFLRGQVSPGEVVHLDLVYWPRDFNQLARVHVKAWRADTDQLRVLVNQFEEPVDSPARFYDWMALENEQPDEKTRILWYYDFKISY